MRFPVRNILSTIMCKAIVALHMITLCACDSLIYDDLDPCDQGLRLRFVYNYNMEFANAFPSQVHCLSLYVFDSDGKYVLTRTVTDRDLLGDEDWRMVLDVPAGDYKLLAYGGMACDDASFSFDRIPSAEVDFKNVGVFLKPSCITQPKGTCLHDLFYGALDVTVPAGAPSYTEATVPMMKDTNNVRIVLQHIDGTPVDDADFNYEIVADNTQLDYANRIVPTAPTHYLPWARGQQTAGLDAGTGDKVVAAFAEMSTSRLVGGNDVRLNITRADGSGEVLSIPLIDYLMLLKSEQFAYMPQQEFLDRESFWNLVFFLDHGNRWLRTQIIINGWVVRINDFES